jgi:hypothetical protein
MNDQNFSERYDHSKVIEKTDPETNDPVENSDHYAPSISADEMASQMAPQSETIPLGAPTSANVGSPAALLDREISEHFRTRWSEIQGKFVDEPRTAVQEADELVTAVVQKITQMFASEHSSLESQWNQGSDVSTEDLRKALQRYRTFFNRLVS